MSTLQRFTSTSAAATLFFALAAPSHAQSIVNGGFESGFTGWTRADQLGSDGTFLLQTGAVSPINGFAVPAPPGGITAAMTDAGAGGSHALYQDFVVPAAVTPGTKLSFSVYLRNAAATYHNPGSLDWASTNIDGLLNLNQQARVDIMTSSSDAFSVGAGDVLLNLFQTDVSTPPTLGYITIVTDVTALLQAHQGQTLRLRFAEVDNVNYFNMGVDDAGFILVPLPPAIVATCGAIVIATIRRRGTV